MTTFHELGLNHKLLQSISDMGFEHPTEIQEKVIPTLLETRTDLVALAQTGTGKTAAFGFPILEYVDLSDRTTQALILSPTRELCLQITKELQLYGSHMSGLNVVAIYGGASISDQIKEIKRGAHVVVATPGRMKDMIRRGAVDISSIAISVLDEADEMLNMGFYEDITDILSNTPEDKQTWLFSATMPKEVARIARDFMQDPLEITVGSRNISSEQVSHEYYLVSSKDRYLALKRLADVNPDLFAVVFCRTKRETQQVADKLIEDGYSASALHGDLSQNQRDLVMKSFRNRQIQLLVATDIAARGIDVEDITHVIHYQLPDEPETYNHRSGRTGRAGKTGVSMVLTTLRDKKKMKDIEKVLNKKMEQKDVPTAIEICENQLLALARKVYDTEINHEIENYLYALNEILGDLSKEELIKKFFSVEFTRFYDYYQQTRDVSRARAEGGLEDTVRLFINLGEKDGYDKNGLKAFLVDMLSLRKDEIYHLDVKPSFSFFNTDKKYIDKIISFFSDFYLGDRKVNVELTHDDADTRSNGAGRSGKRKGRHPRGKRNLKPGAERRISTKNSSSAAKKRKTKKVDTRPKRLKRK